MLGVCGDFPFILGVIYNPHCSHGVIGDLPCIPGVFGDLPCIPNILGHPCCSLVVLVTIASILGVLVTLIVLPVGTAAFPRLTSVGDSLTLVAGDYYAPCHLGSCGGLTLLSGFLRPPLSASPQQCSYQSWGLHSFP